jgi:hypothetical protein
LIATLTHAPDHIGSLRDSFALHLEATRQPSTTKIYLAALDGLIRHLEVDWGESAAASRGRIHHHRPSGP